MVEGVVEVEAVTCCAGDIACPIAVASALERAPILTVTDDDDWDNGGELFIAILTKQMHFVLSLASHTPPKRRGSGHFTATDLCFTPRSWRDQSDLSLFYNVIVGASLSEPLLDELAGAFLWYIYIYI